MIESLKEDFKWQIICSKSGGEVQKNRTSVLIGGMDQKTEIVHQTNLSCPLVYFSAHNQPFYLSLPGEPWKQYLILFRSQKLKPANEQSGCNLQFVLPATWCCPATLCSSKQSGIVDVEMDALQQLI